MKKQRCTASDWAKRINEWEHSGLSGVQFGKRHGIAPGVLYAWKHRLQKKPIAHGQRRVNPGGVGFVEAQVVERHGAAASAGVEIVLSNGRVVRVRGAVDATSLAEILRAAEGRC